MFKKLVLTLGAAVAMVAHAAEIEWMTDLEAAGKKAAQENKLLLVEFTGSDWCRYCILQKKNVLDKPAFAEWANKKKLLGFVKMQLKMIHQIMNYISMQLLLVWKFVSLQADINNCNNE